MTIEVRRQIIVPGRAWRLVHQYYCVQYRLTGRRLLFESISHERHERGSSLRVAIATITRTIRRYLREEQDV